MSDGQGTLQAIEAERRAERVPPHSDEAEVSVLGGMMLEESAVDRAMEILGEDDFYHPAHRHLFRAIAGLRDEGHAPDALAVREELKRRGVLDEAGGAEYLARIVDVVPTAANVAYHAKIVLDAAIKRRLIRTGTEIVGEAYDGGEDADRLLNAAEERIFRLSEHRFKKSFTPINELLQRAVVELESLASRKEAITGVPSGYKDLDDITAGFQLSDLVIVAARPSLGKCLSFDSEIVLESGRIATIEEIVREREARLLTLGDDLRFRPASPSAFVDDGVKPVFRVTTRLGRTIETTLTHPFLTLRGWKRLGEIEVGRRIAVPRRVDVFGGARARECEVVLLAYLIGDGGLTGRSPRFTNTSARIRADFERAVDAFGGVRVHHQASNDRAPTLRVVTDRDLLVRRRKAFAERLAEGLAASGRTARAVASAAGVSPASMTGWRQGRYAPEEPAFERLCGALDMAPEGLAPHGLASVRKNAPNAVTRWLEALGLMGEGAAGKHVPAFVFELPRDQVALFLNRLFATDGWATVQRTGQTQIGYATVSERLARQVQHLLLRFGIVAATRRRMVRYAGGRRTAWQVGITDGDSTRAFIDEIGIYGKEDALERVRAARAGRNPQTNRDLIPLPVWEIVEEALGGRSWAWLARAMGLGPEGTNIHAWKRRPGRRRLARMAEALDHDGLRALATSDVLWDEIASIEYVGRKRVYDLTIPETHNFVANDVCVHNTSLALNLAANAAIVHDLPVAVFSLEMSTEQLVQRLISTEALVSLNTLRMGQASGEQWKRVADACDRLRRAAIYIDDTGLLTPIEMRAKARRLKQQRDIGMVIVDYLQLMETSGRSESRQQEISEISRSLKALAKELNIPVVALSQLSRAPEQRTDQRPRLADLRESGAIEQDADLVLFLYRAKGQEDDFGGNQMGQVTEIIVGKNRNGPTGTIELVFLSQFMRFEDYDPHHAT